jgi:hypothetical protein
METHKSQFNRNLSIVLVALYLVTIAIFVYPVLASEPDLTAWWMILINILILSIPLLLLYGSIYVLIRGWHERTTLGRLSPRLAKIIRWAPRLAAILIIFFVGLFSLDVFGSGAPPLEVLGAFLMHNIPSIAMLILLAFAWKRPVVGFVAFLMVAAAFSFFFFSGGNLLLFILPILLIAFLFYADWQWLKPSGMA